MESPVNVQGIKGMSIMRKEWKGGGGGGKENMNYLVL